VLREFRVKVVVIPPTLGAIRRERRIYRHRQVADDVHELIDEDATLVASTYPGGECGPGGRIEH
jgi:hypothetical protein